MGPYALWLPLVLALLALSLLVRDARVAPGTLPLVLAPVLPSPLLTVYVLRLGGGFMHARMLLPPLLLLLLPVLVVPARRARVGLAAVVAVWAVVCGTALRLDYSAQDFPVQARTRISDERQSAAPTVGSAPRSALPTSRSGPAAHRPPRAAAHARTAPSRPHEHHGDQPS